MKEILANLALIDTTNFCKKWDIDCSDTHIIKYPRKFTYALVKKNGTPLVTVAFTKNSIPVHLIHN